MELTKWDSQDSSKAELETIALRLEFLHQVFIYAITDLWIEVLMLSLFYCKLNDPSI